MENKVKLSDIISFLGEDAIQTYGIRKDIELIGISAIDQSEPAKIDWIHQDNIKAQQIAEESKARLIICADNVVYNDLLKSQKKVLLVVGNPYQVIAIVGNQFFVGSEKAEIHRTAIISKSAVLGKNVKIGAYAVLEACHVGDDCIIGEHVLIRESVQLGQNVEVGSGARLGGPGFSFFNNSNNSLTRFPQIGSLTIGDRVEIGSNTCIDRGAFSDTKINDDVKINNLCHIAHNVIIGKSTIIAANVNVSGSTTIGCEVWIGPNACFRGHQNVGDRCLIGAGANVISDVPSGEVWAGNPARFLRNNEK